MLPFFWYIVKVTICSGILFGYYWLFLRNKLFHHYNRFYLLAAISLSLLVPLLKFHFWQPAEEQNQAIRVLQAVSAGDEIVLSATQKNSWDASQFYTCIYFLVAFIFLIGMLRTLWEIRRMLKKYEVSRLQNISFVNTEDAGTPFSFLQFIFWNSNIDINTQTGKQIFKHEVAHVTEKHTHDKLFLNIVLIVCWCNPFFWLYRKELNMIHEFIADKKAVENNDAGAFAAMILQAAYPKHRFELANNFFYSPVKRRLMMLAKKQTPRVNYWARIMVLPLAVLVFTAFTFKIKNSLVAPGNLIESAGAEYPAGINVNVPDTLPTQQQWEVAAGKKSSDTTPKIKSLSLYEAGSGKPLMEVDGQNQKLIYVIDDVVQKPDFNLNSINPNDIASVEVVKNQSAIAGYGIPGKEGVIIIKTKKISLTGVNPLTAENDLLDKRLAELNNARVNQQLAVEKQGTHTRIYLEKKLELAKIKDSIQGIRVEEVRINKLEEKQLAELKAYNKSKLAYANKLDEVVVQGYALKEKLREENITKEPAIVKVDIDPMFTGGDASWKKYLMANLKSAIPVEEGWKAGKYTVMVKFIVHADGSISNVTTENFKGTKTAQHCIAIIAGSPKWQPAMVNGKKVTAYKKQPITFIIAE